MLKRARFWIPAAAAAGVALATVSYAPAVSLHLVDGQGAPAADAYVGYYYAGSVLNPVHPVTYVARERAIARADASGRPAVGGRVHLRAPLPLSTPPRPFIEHVYVPRLHNAFGPVAGGTTSRPGVFVLDGATERVTVLDVSPDPVLWESSLRHLFDMIRSSLRTVDARPRALAADDETAVHARALISHLRREYAELVAAHGDTLRERNVSLERTWRRKLSEMNTWEASLGR